MDVQARQIAKTGSHGLSQSTRLLTYKTQMREAWNKLYCKLTKYIWRGGKTLLNPAENGETWRLSRFKFSSKLIINRPLCRSVRNLRKYRKVEDPTQTRVLRADRYPAVLTAARPLFDIDSQNQIPSGNCGPVWIETPHRQFHHRLTNVPGNRLINRTVQQLMDKTSVKHFCFSDRQK